MTRRALRTAGADAHNTTTTRSQTAHNEHDDTDNSSSSTTTHKQKARRSAHEEHDDGNGSSSTNNVAAAVAGMTSAMTRDDDDDGDATSTVVHAQQNKDSSGSCRRDRQPLAATMPQPPLPPYNALVVLGTYQAVLIGLVLRRDAFFLKFSIKPHIGSISAMAATTRYIATCGVDERVALFTNKTAAHEHAPRRRHPPRSRNSSTDAAASLRLADLGSLTPPAEVTCMAFTPPPPPRHTRTTTAAAGTTSSSSQHLYCGCADGQLLAYRTRDWALCVQLPVHLKALRALAVHPRSAGALVVSVGADRRVAVLDMTAGRLLTKWTYNTVIASSDSNNNNSNNNSSNSSRADDVGDDDNDEDNNSSSSSSHVDRQQDDDGNAAASSPLSRQRRDVPTAQRRAGKRRRTERSAHTTDADDDKNNNSNNDDDDMTTTAALTPLRVEEPLGLCFDARGDRLVVYARFSFVVYDVRSMTAMLTHRMHAPQPHEELHTCIFVQDTSNSNNSSSSAAWLLLGNEAGQLLCCRVPAVTTATTTTVAATAEVQRVRVVYPSHCADAARALCATALCADRETRQKHPLRHTSRVKAAVLCAEDEDKDNSNSNNTTAATRMHLFTTDSNGVVIAWRVQCPTAAAATADDAAVYVDDADDNEANTTTAAAAAAAQRLTLHYVNSANCQGRATCMTAMTL